jgi:hypothetical protein
MSLETRSADSVATRVWSAIHDVPPGYFGAIAAPIMRGRDYVSIDMTLVVTPIVIAESIAVALFGSTEPIGRRVIRRAWNDETPHEMEAIGVVRMDRESSTIDYPSETPAFYAPLTGSLNRAKESDPIARMTELRSLTPLIGRRRDRRPRGSLRRSSFRGRTCGGARPTRPPIAPRRPIQ